MGLIKKIFKRHIASINKHYIKVGLFTLAIFTFLNSFSQKKETDNNSFKNSKFNSIDSSNEVFVITSDGVKHSGKVLKFSPTHFSFSRFIKIDNVKYNRKNLKDIIAWQDENEYRVYFSKINEDCKRLLKGKINLYQYPFLFHGTLYIQYFFEKEKFNFVDGTIKNMESLFANNPSVLEKLNELYPEKIIKNGDRHPPQNSMKQENEIYQNMMNLVNMYNK